MNIPCGVCFDLGFHKLAKKHNWSRPNDLNGISLMNRAAKTVMEDFNDIVLSYGQSDEYSFVFRKETDVSLLMTIQILFAWYNNYCDWRLYLIVCFRCLNEESQSWLQLWCQSSPLHLVSTGLNSFLKSNSAIRRHLMVVLYCTPPTHI